MTAKRVLVAWSGGKDSAWALHLLRSEPDVEIAGLFTTTNEADGHVAVHGVRPELLARQAQAAGAPLHTVVLPQPCANAQYEQAMSALAAKALAMGVTHLAFGDLFLEEIRRYRERQFAGSGLSLLFPLWGRPTAALGREMTAAGTRAWIVCVDTSRAPREWAGRCFDAGFVQGVPDGIDPCGENGEFHTFVFAGPMLRDEVPCRPGQRVDRDRFTYADLEPA